MKSPGRRRHLKKDVEAALRYAEAAGWSVIEVHRAHRWGQLRCPAGTHQLAVPSTPRKPDYRRPANPRDCGPRR